MKKKMKSSITNLDHTLTTRNNYIIHQQYSPNNTKNRIEIE